MRSNLLTNSRFGKFYPSSNNDTVQTITLDKIQEIKSCKLTTYSERLYLLDTTGNLSCLNLKEQTLSTLNNHKLQYFHPDGSNSLSLVAISPTSQILSIRFENKEVQRVLNPCLNSLIGFQKNYLTETILLLQPKLLVLVDNNRKIKSLKAKGNDLFVSACLLGINSYFCVLLRSGKVQIYQTSTLKMVDSIQLPFGGKDMKVTATSKGKHIAIYGNNCWLFLLHFDKKLQCKLSELPFQSVLDLQYTYAQEIVLLGSDRVLYGVSFGEDVSLKPIFNHDNAYIPTSFDVSVDEKLVSVAAGKAVHLLSFKEGIKTAIRQSENGTVINFTELSGSSSRILQVNNQIQNVQPIQTKKQEVRKEQMRLKQYKLQREFQNQNGEEEEQQQQYMERGGRISNEPSAVKVDTSQQLSIDCKIYGYLSKFKELQSIISSYQTHVLTFITQLYQKNKNPQICASLSLQILRKLSEITNNKTLESLALTIAPETVQNCRKYGISINMFVTRLVLGFFKDYFPFNNAEQLWQSFVSNLNQQRFCQAFLILLLQIIQQNQSSSEDRKQIPVRAFQEKVQKMLKTVKNTEPFAKTQTKVTITEKLVVKQGQKSGQSLSVLLARQEKIKSGLKNLRAEIERR